MEPQMENKLSDEFKLQKLAEDITEIDTTLNTVPFDSNKAIQIIKKLPPNNNSPLIIKFYGHSLSEADYSYFQSIFDYYNLYSNCRMGLVFYYSEGYEQTDEIYRLINVYGDTLSNQKQGKNLIHKLLLENRLKIVPLS